MNCSSGQPDTYCTSSRRRYDAITVDLKRSSIVHNRHCKAEGKLDMLCVINRWPLIVGKHTTIVILSSRDSSIEENIPRLTLRNNVIVNIRSPTQTIGRKHDPSSHCKWFGPTPQVRGRARREPFGGVAAESTGWSYKHASSPEFNTHHFPTQPFLLDKLLPDTSLHLHPAIHAPSSPNYLLTTPSIWSKQVRGHEQTLPRREQLTNILSQQSSLVPLVVSDR